MTEDQIFRRKGWFVWSGFAVSCAHFAVWLIDREWADATQFPYMLFMYWVFYNIGKCAGRFSEQTDQLIKRRNQLFRDL